MQLTQKETTLLKDLKDQEQLCTDKYTKYSASASDPQLKNLFSRIAATEQGHFNTLNQIANGTVPSISGASQTEIPKFSAKYSIAPSAEKQNDCFLCTDTLTSEKHVSSLYNTCIFEFKDEQLRNVLNHIQKEEQLHGKMLYDYMQANSMY